MIPFNIENIELSSSHLVVIRSASSCDFILKLIHFTIVFSCFALLLFFGHFFKTCLNSKYDHMLRLPLWNCSNFPLLLYSNAPTAIRIIRRAMTCPGSKRQNT